MLNKREPNRIRKSKIPNTSHVQRVDVRVMIIHVEVLVGRGEDLEEAVKVRIVLKRVYDVRFRLTKMLNEYAVL